MARSLVRYPRLYFYPQAALFVICILFTIRHLNFSTDRNDLIDARKEYHRQYLTYLRDFRGENEVVAAVESEDREKNRQFVERLGAKLEKESNLPEGERPSQSQQRPVSAHVHGVPVLPEAAAVSGHPSYHYGRDHLNSKAVTPVCRRYSGPSFLRFCDHRSPSPRSQHVSS